MNTCFPAIRGVGSRVIFHPEFKDLKEALQENPIKYATQVLFNGMEDKPELALKVLEKLAKKYKQKQDVALDLSSFESMLDNLKSEGGGG